MPEAASPRKLEIKKYANRRYYDSTHSRHLTLEEIRALIQQGYDLQVLDGKTGADITGQVLTQIILELDTPKLDSLPVPMLLRLIRMNDLLFKDFIEKYFNQALKSFFEYQQQMEEQLRRTQGLPPAFPGVSAWARMFEPFANAFSSFERQSAGQNASGTSNVNADMAREIDELRKEISRLKTRKPAPKRPKRR